ncbi:MAG: matrixin family metalloprotease [Nitrospira sp.]|nr:matrixin family metalloprotease [Nitrospira sp.]
MAGSWAGDILFNSEADFTSLDQVYSVAMHEIGHVLGLGHSTDVNSPMYSMLDGKSHELTATDIALIQALYGVRGADIHEGASGNGTTETATAIQSAGDVEEGVPAYDGTTPLIEFGDIASPTDVDIFSVTKLANYLGNISVQVRAAGVSQLAPKLTIVKRNGTVVSSQTGTAGGDVRLTFDSQTVNQSFYFRVESAVTGTTNGGTNSFGAYSVVVTYDSLNTISESRIATVVRYANDLLGFEEEGINEADTARMFRQTSGLPILDDDQHHDDEIAAAKELEPVSSSQGYARFQSIESLSDNHDVDVFKVESPHAATPQSLEIVVQSLDEVGLIPAVRIYDENHRAVTANVLSNGLGQLVVQAKGIKSGATYSIQIASANGNAFASGNYRMSITISDKAVEPTTYLRGNDSASVPLREHTMYIAQSQLLSLALESSISGNGASSGSGANGVIWATIYDQDRQPVHLIAGPVGETRSATSVLLNPGEYTIQIGVQGLDPSATISYGLVGESLAEPAGVPISDPTTIPIYSCPETSGVYCYPGPIVTPSTIQVTPPQPTISYPIPIPIPMPIDIWFWKMSYLATNPVNAFDVNNDKVVSPGDALAIINDLNVNLSRAVPAPPTQIAYLDVNADGAISPLDALIVINHLNSSNGALGEASSANGLSIQVPATSEVPVQSSILAVPNSVTRGGTGAFQTPSPFQLDIGQISARTSGALGLKLRLV